MNDDANGVRVSPEDRRNLGNWLREWKIDKTLAGAGVFGNTRSSGVGHVGCADAERRKLGRRRVVSGQSLQVGQIRLLGRLDRDESSMAECELRPLYVAVLEERALGRWLIAPFSRFAIPATPGEWKTGMKAAPLRVLCVWNARVVASRVLEQAWYAGTMTAAKVSDALDVLRHATEGVPLQRVKATRVGPPLLHPLDPRHEYLQEERALLAGLLGFQGNEEVAQEPLIYEIPPSEQRKAAEDRGEYGKEGKGKKG